MTAYRGNLNHTQKLKKKSYNKHVKPKTFAPGNNIWLNNRYVKTKRNHKLEAELFEFFSVLHSVKNQVYKLEVLKKWRIHNIFNVLLLE